MPALSCRLLPLVGIFVVLGGAALLPGCSCEDEAASGGGAEQNNGLLNNGTGGTTGGTGGTTGGRPDSGGGGEDTGPRDSGEGEDSGEVEDSGEGEDTDPGDGGGGEDTESPDAPVEDTSVEDEEEACIAINATADNRVLPVDIIWIVDASPSMETEIGIIEDQLTSFAQRIGASGLDYRVIMIGSDREYCFDARCYYAICIPEPLSAGPGCPDQDSERYLHVREGVHSSDGLDIAIATYDQWRSFRRAEAITHFVMVTDDDVGFGTDAEEFTQFLESAQDPGFPGGVFFHSIVDLEDSEPGCGVFGDPPCSCGDERGDDYIALSEATGGLVHSICAEDWTPIFEGLEARVIDGTALPCEYIIPDPGEGLIVDPEEVNVVFVDGMGNRELLFNVDDAAGCADADGWYFDNPFMPSVVHLCPGACDGSDGGVEMEFGCETVKVP